MTNEKHEKNPYYNTYSLNLFIGIYNMYYTDKVIGGLTFLYL